MSQGGGWFFLLQAPADVDKRRPTHDDILKWDNSLKRWVLANISVYSATDFVYFGAVTTNGTWRIGRSGNNLNFERREAGLWVRKGAMLP